MPFRDISLPSQRRRLDYATARLPLSRPTSYLPLYVALSRIEHAAQRTRAPPLHHARGPRFRTGTSNALRRIGVLLPKRNDTPRALGLALLVVEVVAQTIGAVGQPQLIDARCERWRFSCQRQQLIGKVRARTRIHPPRRWCPIRSNLGCVGFTRQRPGRPLVPLPMKDENAVGRRADAGEACCGSDSPCGKQVRPRSRTSRSAGAEKDAGDYGAFPRRSARLVTTGGRRRPSRRSRRGSARARGGCGVAARACWC